MSAEALLGYGMTCIGTVKITDDRFTIDLLNRDAGELEKCIYAFVVGGEIGKHDPPKSVTISQFFVTKDRMFEVAIFLPNAEKSSKADLLAHARKVCDDWRSHIVVKR